MMIKNPIKFEITFITLEIIEPLHMCNLRYKKPKEILLVFTIFLIMATIL